MKKFLFLVVFLLSLSAFAQQHSVARVWNDVLLEAIRHDFARPTVHARNLFHSSMMMYDIWATYNEKAETFFLGKTVDGFTCPFDGFPKNENIVASREEAISYAMYKLLSHRFKNSPGAAITLPLIENKFKELGYDNAFVGMDYENGNAAAFGNYIAENVIEFGLQDGANEG